MYLLSSDYFYKISNHKQHTSMNCYFLKVLFVMGDFVDLYDSYTNRDVPYKENYVSDFVNKANSVHNFS